MNELVPGSDGLAEGAFQEFAEPKVAVRFDLCGVFLRPVVEAGARGGAEFAVVEHCSVEGWRMGFIVEIA